MKPGSQRVDSLMGSGIGWAERKEERKRGEGGTARRVLPGAEIWTEGRTFLQSRKRAREKDSKKTYQHSIMQF